MVLPGLADISFGLLIGYGGIALSLVSTFMRGMQPLRVVAIVGNVAGLSYGFLESVWPSFFGNLILLHINAYRLWEIRRLARAVAEAQRDTTMIEVLLPQMRRENVKAGTRLFTKGEEADVMYYLRHGVIHLPEAGKRMNEGTLFGEAGLFTRDAKRTLSADCESDCELYSMTREQLLVIYFQNPQIGFNLMQLLVENLLERRPPPPRTEESPAAASS